MGPGLDSETAFVLLLICGTAVALPCDANQTVVIECIYEGIALGCFLLGVAHYVAGYAALSYP